MLQVRSRLLTAAVALLAAVPAFAQYSLQVQAGFSGHGTGDLRGQEMRVAAGRTLGRIGELKLAYQHSSFSSEYNYSELRGRGDGDDFAIGQGGVAFGAHDEYTRVTMVTLGLTRDSKLFGPVYAYTGLAGGVYRMRRKSLAAARLVTDELGDRGVDLEYLAESYGTAVLSVDLGLLYKVKGLTVGPYLGGHFAGRGDGMSALGLLVRVNWPGDCE